MQAFGRDALHLRMRIDQQCHADEGYIVAATPRGGRGITYGHNPVVIDFWVIDLDGSLVVVDSWHPDGASSRLVDRVDQTRKSITFVSPE